MALKPRATRLKLLVLSHREKLGDLSSSVYTHTASGLVPAASSFSPVLSTLTADKTSPCSRCVFHESSGIDRPGGARRVPGRRHLSAVMQVTVRELRTSVTSFQYDLKPDVPKCEGRKLFFDTHAVVRLLEENGFTTQQAEVFVKVLLKMTHSNMDVIYNDMVTKAQQEIMMQRVMSQIAAVKTDMIILEKSEFSTLLAENEKLKIQLLQLKIQLADVMNKVRADTLLDINLEKSRVKEMKADHERKLLETRTEILEMAAEQDRNLTQTNMKIDTEVAGLKTMLESHKLDTIKYLAGSVFTCLTVVLGFYRIWM